jgi:hypothetical protein
MIVQVPDTDGGQRDHLLTAINASIARHASWHRTSTARLIRTASVIIATAPSADPSCGYDFVHRFSPSPAVWALPMTVSSDTPSSRGEPHRPIGHHGR